MWGQRAHFWLFAPEKPPYVVDRYVKEGARLEAVLQRLLDGREFFLSSGYSIVDIAVFGWAWCAVHQGFGLEGRPLCRHGTIALLLGLACNAAS